MGLVIWLSTTGVRFCSGFGRYCLFDGETLIETVQKGLSGYVMGYWFCLASFVVSTSWLLGMDKARL